MQFAEAMNLHSGKYRRGHVLYKSIPDYNGWKRNIEHHK